jgi:hypothetical protein
MRRWILACMVGFGMMSLGLPMRAAVVAAPTHAAAAHPRLGDPLSVWVNDLGKPTLFQDVLLGWHRCKGNSPVFLLSAGVAEHQVIMVEEDFDCSPKPNTPISFAKHLAQATPFLPSDAKKLGTVQGFSHPITEYFSALLAKTKAGETQSFDCHSVLTKPGLFTLSQDTYLDTWTLEVGTCAA